MEENPPQVQAATGLIVSVKADGTVTIEGEDRAVGGGGEPHAGNAVSPIRAFTRRLLELEVRYNLAAEPLPDASEFPFLAEFLTQENTTEQETPDQPPKLTLVTTPKQRPHQPRQRRGRETSVAPTGSPATDKVDDAKETL